MKSHRLLILLFILFLVVVGAFYFYQNYMATGNEAGTVLLAKKERAVEKESIIVGVNSLPSGIYPDIEAEFSDADYSSHIFETLVAFNREGRVVPSLAIKWDNPNDLTWRFYLSPKAKFSNGTPVTAEDVKFSYDYIANSQLPIKESLPAVDQINVIDKKTIEFKTKAPDPLLLNRLAVGMFKVMSKQEVEKNGTKNYIGSGPYKLVEYNEQNLKLTRNENYWGSKPKIKNVTFKIYPKEEDKITALLNKEVDFISYGYASSEYLAKIDQAAKNKEIQKKRMPEPTIVYLDLDTLRDKSPYINSDKNPLKDVRVRQAMYMAININEAISSSKLDMGPVNQLVSQGIFGYNPKIKRPAYNLEKAKDLMKEAGFGDGFEIKIDYLKDPRSEPLFQEIFNQLASINIKVTPNPLEDKQYFEKIAASDSSAYIGAWSADSLDAGEVLENLLHTKTEQYGLYNLGYSNSEVDKLIEEAGKTLDEKSRKQKLQEAMKIAMDEVAKIPLLQNFNKYAFATDISWQPRIDGAIKVYEMAGKAQ
jgi:peptide/nickel transport system substrate-binding protein